MRAGAPQGVKIIAVFDGESSTDKSLEDAERRKRRQKAQVGIEVQMTTPDAEKRSPEWMAEYARLCRGAVSIDWEVKLACITLLHQCGIQFILAPHEADHQLKKLCDEKLADGVIADDFDMLTHGVPKMIGKYKHGSSEGVLRETLGRRGERASGLAGRLSRGEYGVQPVSSHLSVSPSS